MAPCGADVHDVPRGPQQLARGSAHHTQYKYRNLHECANVGRGGRDCTAHHAPHKPTRNMCLHSRKLAICTTLHQRTPAGYPPSHRTATVSVLAAVPARCNPAECHSSTFWEQISPVSPNTYTHEDCSVAACPTGSPDCSVTSPLLRRSMCLWCPICNEQNIKRSLRCSDCGSPLHCEGYAAPKSLDLVNPAQNNRRGPSNRTRRNRRGEDLKTITHKGGTVVDQHHLCTPLQTQPSACLLSSLPELRLPTSLVRARQEDISSLRRRLKVT